MLDKIKSVMIGHAVGDALGVPVEFASRAEIAEKPVTDMEGFGTYPFRLLDAPRKDSVNFALEWADCRCDESSEHDMYKRLFSPDFDKTPASKIKSTGYVVDTLEAAVWCLMTTDNYKDCVKSIMLL